MLNIKNPGEVRMPKNRNIIKEQNNAAKSGKYINKGEALRRIAAKKAEEALMKLKGKR